MCVQVDQTGRDPQVAGIHKPVVFLWAAINLINQHANLSIFYDQRFVILYLQWSDQPAAPDYGPHVFPFPSTASLR
jgi:hypothetical protein